MTPKRRSKNAELVVLAVPVGAMGAAAAACAHGLKLGAIVTDVGSVKQAVVEAVSAALPAHVYFVPGHPLAGTEHSGPDAGFATLFQNRWQILTPLPDQGVAYPAAVDQLEEFWRALGANVERMDAERHDVVLAVVSHLPHLIAFNIVAMAEDLGERHRERSGEVFRLWLSRFHPHRRVRSRRCGATCS